MDFFPVLSLALFIVIVVYLALGRRIIDGVVARAKRKSGQFESWSSLEAKLKAGEGTLIINRSNLDGRVWWTPKVVASRSDAFVLLLNREATFTIPPWFMGLKETALKERYPCAVFTLTGVIRT